MVFAPLPYFGSFQHGLFVRTGTPLQSVWRQVERMGTVESLGRIAAAKGHDPKVAKTASLRVRQAVELRRAAQGASALTKPLTLYYSMLNLTRAIMLAFLGDMGPPTHGLQFRAGGTLLECAAQVGKKGTFVQFAQTLGAKDRTANKTISLRDLLAVLPEMNGDFPLLGAGPSSVAVVRVEALMGGDLFLTFRVANLSAPEFEAGWTSLFPWLDPAFELATGRPFTLRFRVPPKDEVEVGEICRKYLIPDLLARQDPVWFDHVERNGVVLLPRALAYLAAMFILSNVSRYEPEHLAEPLRDLNDVGFVLDTFLGHAERFYPQVILELVNGTQVFFD